MTDDPSLRPTRRSFLAGGSALASSALAGCSAIPDDLLGGGPTTIAGSKLQSIAAGSVPTVPRPTPAPVEDAKLDAVREQTTKRLSTVPFPLTAEEIPNGAVREELAESRDRTRQLLEHASAASSAYAALQALSDARVEAERAAVTWEAIDAGLTYDDVAERAPQIQQDLDAFRDQWTYEGTEPVDAVLVHRAIERRLNVASRRAALDADRPIQPDHAINVGRLAETLESARTSLDGARYVYARFRETTTHRQPLRDRFVAARESIRATCRNERDALPEFDDENPTVGDRDVGGTPAGRALEVLYDSISTPVRHLWDDRELTLATSVLALHERLAKIRAFAAFRSRIADGADVRIESAADVRARREAAIAGIETAVAETTRPVLTRAFASDLVEWIAHADEELRKRRDDSVRVEWIAHEVAYYVMVAEIARVLPRTSADVGSALV